MKTIDTIYRATRYIEKHLMDNISIEDVAGEAGYSLFHFSRIFNQYIGHSPYDYIMRRRLTEAAKAILDTEQSIMDITLDYQFNNSVSFSRAFKKVFGIAPVQLRRSQQALIHYKEAVSYDYIYHINNHLIKVPDIRQLDGFYLLGQIQWENNSLGNNTNTEYDYRIRFFPRNFRKKIPYYMIGKKTNQIERTPDDYVLKYFSLGNYAEFSHRGQEASIYMTYDYIFQTWLPKTGYRLANEYVLEECKGDLEKELIKVYVPIIKN